MLLLLLIVLLKLSKGREATLPRSIISGLVSYGVVLIRSEDDAGPPSHISHIIIGVILSYRIQARTAVNLVHIFVDRLPLLDRPDAQSLLAVYSQALLAEVLLKSLLVEVLRLLVFGFFVVN